jgi:hypothetical protein
MDVKEVGCEHVRWIHVAEDRGQWRTLANMSLNFGFHKRQGIPRVAEQVLVSQ